MSSEPPSSCQTCFSDLRGPPAFVPPCCGAPVCAACVSANPRLTSWVPCLRCGAGAATRTKPKPTPADVAGLKKTQVERPRGRAPRTRDVEEQFVLVGDDESGDEVDDGVEHDGKEDGAGANGGAGGVGSGEGKADDKTDAVAEPELVEIKHTLRRGDTVLSIARAYATDPHTLLSLNDLPHAALYANPALIRTRKALVVSRRLVNHSAGDGGVSEDVTETPERKAQRAMRRFQAVAKAEEGVARAYLALHASRDAQSSDGQAFHRGLGGADAGADVHGGGGDVVWSFDDTDSASPTSPAKTTGVARPPPFLNGTGDAEKKPTTDAAAPGVDGALEHYFDDEAWEAGAARPARGRDGRWRVVGAVLPPGVKAE